MCERPERACPRSATDLHTRLANGLLRRCALRGALVPAVGKDRVVGKLRAFATGGLQLAVSLRCELRYNWTEASSTNRCTATHDARRLSFAVVFLSVSWGRLSSLPPFAARRF